MLELLYELEDVAGRAAAETAVAAHLLAHVERAALLGVERAQADPVSTDATQRDRCLDHVDDRHRRADPLDVFVHDRHSGEVTGGVRDRNQRWRYFVSLLLAPEDAITACAAARRAIGTRNGLQLT